MECLRSLFCYRQPDGHCNQSYPPVFYVRFYPHGGFPDHHLHGAGFLEKYEEVYLGGETKSMVLSIM